MLSAGTQMGSVRQKYTDPCVDVSLLAVYFGKRRFHGRGRVLRCEYDIQGVYEGLYFA